MLSRKRLWKMELKPKSDSWILPFLPIYRARGYYRSELSQVSSRHVFSAHSVAILRDLRDSRLHLEEGRKKPERAESAEIVPR